MRDQNDIPFNEYSIDFFGFVDLIFSFFFGGGNTGGGTGGGGFLDSWSPGAVFEWLSGIWSFMVVMSWIVSFILVFGIIYAYIRHNHLNEVFAEILRRQEEVFQKLHRHDVKNARWQDVLTHIDSDRPNDWKLAIIEADIVLEEMLESLGYAGTTVSEKLKSASPNAFSTISHAWSAHGIRNKIAHQGADFNLTKLEAQQTVAEYKMVFEEFDFI